MKKIILAVLSSLTLCAVTTTAYANIWLSAYNSKYKPKTGHYYAKIVSVQVGISYQQDPNGQKTNIKHNYVYVGTENADHDNLQFSFNEDDLANGLSLMGAVGKTIDFELELDSNNKLLVENFSVNQYQSSSPNMIHQNR